MLSSWTVEIPAQAESTVKQAKAIVKKHARFRPQARNTPAIVINILVTANVILKIQEELSWPLHLLSTPRISSQSASATIAPLNISCSTLWIKTPLGHGHTEE
jgi:hypothetical protein